MCVFHVKFFGARKKVVVDWCLSLFLGDRWLDAYHHPRSETPTECWRDHWKKSRNISPWLKVGRFYLVGHHHLFIDFLSFLCDDATLVCAHPTFIYIQGLINRVKCSVRLFGALFFHLKFSPRDVQHWCGTQLSSLWNFQGEDLFEVEVLWVPLVIAGDGSATVKCCFWRDWDIETTFFLFESSRRESPVGMGASICHHRAGS